MNFSNRFFSTLMLLLGITVLTVGCARDSDDDAPAVIPPAACAALGGLAIAGPHDNYGFCFYLGAQGEACDAVCGSLSRTNVADDVATAHPDTSPDFPDTCTGATPTDESTYFYNNGNAGNWTNGTGWTGYKSLGYGYDSNVYFGKCVAATGMGTGTFPGDANGSITRATVCACSR